MSVFFIITWTNNAPNFLLAIAKQSEANELFFLVLRKKREAERQLEIQKGQAKKQTTHIN
jgi:hypothetical protein